MPSVTVNIVGPGTPYTLTSASTKTISVVLPYTVLIAASRS
jgi:hypothetical protein